MSYSAVSSASKAGWEHFPHDADVGVRGSGSTAQRHSSSGPALTAVVTQWISSRRSRSRCRCEAPDLELLFVEWLNAVIYEMAVRNMLFGRFAVQDRR